MKAPRTFVIILLLIVFFNLKQGYSQLRFGVFVDPQLTWLNSDTKVFTPNGPTINMNFGFMAEKLFADRYSILTGLSINSIGGNLKYNEVGYSIKTTDNTYLIAQNANVKIKGQYLTLPLGFKFKTIEIGYLTIYANIGLNGNIRLKGYVWEDSINVDKETATEQFNPVFGSYFIGGGVLYSLGGPSSLQFGLTYNGGLSEFFKTGHGTIATSGLSLRVGLIF